MVHLGSGVADIRRFGFCARLNINQRCQSRRIPRLEPLAGHRRFPRDFGQRRAALERRRPDGHRVSNRRGGHRAGAAEAAFRELSIVDVGRLGNEVPFLRPADGAISIAIDRRVSDGAVVSTSFDVHMPQRGAGVFHLALASLPVSTIVSLKLRVGDQSPLR